MDQSKLHFDTLQVHAGQGVDRETQSRAVPIYQTTSYVFDDARQAGARFDLKEDGYIYTRLNNPTTDVLEKRVAALEGGAAAVATASGMAAITYAILNIAHAGDEVIALSTLYGGTFTLIKDRLESFFGVKTHLVDPDDLEAVAAAINERTRLIYLETLGNPDINIPDIQAVAELAHAHGLPLIADNTFGTPYLIRVKEWGVDVVVHSLTKYLGGHGTSIGGIVVDLGTFNWKGGRFAEFAQPDPTYHGIVYGDIPGGFAVKIRAQLLRDTGACISPFNAFLILQGIETLSLRLDRHCANARRIAAFLQGHPVVSWVNYPGLPGDRYYERAQRYFPKGVGGILTFGVKGGVETGRAFIDSLEIFSLLANVADAKSLVIHPASTTHAQLSPEAMIAAGVKPEMVRLSVGIEDADDLIADLDQALRAAYKEG
ncbi:MAG: O-acetylhomoserine aminocarboxypropyltransferase/cysteine synthase family protein [Christensenellales bacterium]|jgi:O-acetylhomoserine (thiol)-lyase